MVKLFNKRLYFLLNRRPKEGDKFFEFSKPFYRSSYENKIYECTGGSDNFVFSGDFDKNTAINHPFPDTCKPILFSIPFFF